MEKIRRIERELLVAKQDKDSGVIIETQGDNLVKLRGVIPGPVDTPYEGGRFAIEIDLEGNYPYSPPKMRFLTKVFHPNISSQTGAICLDILRDNWTPALTLKGTLISLQALLSSPEPDDPQDAVVASLYKSDHKKFLETAKAWTETHAHPSGNEKKVTKLAEMGFDHESIRRVLEECGWDEDAALERLLAL